MADHCEPLANQPLGQPLPASVDRRLLELERERLRLASRYDEILQEVVDGDSTGYALIRVSSQLKKLTDELERVRRGE